MKTFEMNSDIYLGILAKDNELSMSFAFASCADQQLSAAFERDSGIKIGKRISIGWAHSSVFFYNKASTSKFASAIWINNHKNDITIAWKSKSGKIYDVADTNIDCNDLDFWFEGFDALLYQKQFYPNDKLPFKLKDISYDLVVTRMNMDQTVEITLKPTSLSDENAVTEKIDQFIGDYNAASEKRDREHGVVHNWKSTLEGDRLIYEIDMGSTGAYFMKELLQFLSKLEAFEKVEVM